MMENANGMTKLISKSEKSILPNVQKKENLWEKKH